MHAGRAQTCTRAVHEIIVALYHAQTKEPNACAHVVVPRKYTGGGSSPRWPRITVGKRGGRFASKGTLPVGTFVRLRGRSDGVHRRASASSNDVLDGLDGLAEVARLHLRFALWPGGDEEQPPEDDEQLCIETGAGGGCRKKLQPSTEHIVEGRRRGIPH